jgi:hypothetical protein
MQVVPAQAVPPEPASTAAEESGGATVIEGSVHAKDDPVRRFGREGAATLQRATGHLQAGELQQVRELLKPIVSRVVRDPGDGCTQTQYECLRAEALAGLAQCLRREGAFTEDVLSEQFALFDLACQMRPQIAAYHAATADTLHKRGRLREAGERLESALSLAETMQARPDLSAEQRTSVILFAEDVADTRRWRLQLELVQTQLKNATEAAERELLAGLEEEARAEAEDASRRKQKRAQRAAKKKEKAEQAAAAARHHRMTAAAELEPEPEPEPEPEQWPPPEDPEGDGGVLRPLSGTDATAPDGAPITMVLAVPSANQPLLLTVTATAAVEADSEELPGGAGSPDGVAAATANGGAGRGPEAAGAQAALAASAVDADELQELEEVEAEEVDEAAVPSETTLSPPNFHTNTLNFVKTGSRQTRGKVSCRKETPWPFSAAGGRLWPEGFAQPCGAGGAAGAAGGVRADARGEGGGGRLDGAGGCGRGLCGGG